MEDCWEHIRRWVFKALLQCFVRGRGLQVASGAAEHCRAERLQLIRERLHEALLEARRSGLSEEEIAGLVERELRAAR